MKTIQLQLLIILTIICAGCAWRQNHQGIKLAAEGITTSTMYFNANKDVLKHILLESLTNRGYIIDKIDGYNISASTTSGAVAQQIVAKYNITVDNEKIYIDTKGSSFKGTPFLPIRFLKILRKDIKVSLGEEKWDVK
mgnify:CR=1 FL=1